MRDRLPVELDNMELPFDKYNRIEQRKSNSYGYVSILSLLSLIITLGSVLAIIFLGNR